MVGEVGYSEIVVNLPVTNAPGCLGSNAKTLGLQHLHFLDMGASSRPTDGAHIVHHGTDELLIQQNTIVDGEAASSVQEGSQRSRSLCRFLSYLIDVFRRDEAFIKGHPQDNGHHQPIGLAPRRAVLIGLRDAPTGLDEEHRRALRDIDGDPFTQPPL